MTNFHEKKLAQIIPVSLAVKKIQIHKYNINYAEAGSGPALLLIHGINIGWGQWYPNIAELSQHFRVIALDLPGAGCSTKIDFETCDFEKDFVDVVDEFIRKAGLEKVSIMGHSLGGWVALKLALRDESYLDKIVLVDPVGFTDYVPLKYKICAFYPLAKLLSKTVMKPTQKNMEKFSRDVMCRKRIEVRVEFTDYLCNSITREKITHPLLLINRMIRFGKIAPELVLVNKLSNVRNKTLIIMGDSDPMIPLSKVTNSFRLVPNVRVEVFSSVGHLPFLEDSERFNQLAITFLNS